MPNEAFQRKPTVGYNPMRSPLPFDTDQIPEKAADRIATMAVGIRGGESPEDLTSLHNNIKTSLMERGESEEIFDILSEQALLQEDEAIEDMELTVSDPFLSNEEKIDTLFNILEDAKVPVNVRGAFLRKFAVEGTAETGTGEELQQTIASRLDDIRESRAAIRQAKLVNLNFDENTVTDFLTGVILPGSFSLQIVDVVNEVFPDIAGASGLVDPGGVVQAVKDRLRESSPEERRDKVLALIDAIDKNEFYGMDNGFVKWDMLNTLLDDYQDSNWERTVNNIFGVADLFAFLELVRVGKFVKNAKTGFSAKVSGTKEKPIVTASEEAFNEALEIQRQQALLRKDPESPSGMLDQVSPEDSARIVESALENQDFEAMERLGVTPESLTVEHLGFKVPDAPISVAPDINRLTAVDSPDIRRLAFTQEELDQFQTNIVDRIKDLQSTVDYVHFNKASLVETPRGYIGRAIVGSSPERGFSNRKTAEAVARKYQRRLGAYHIDTKILVRDYKKGEFVPVDTFKIDPKQKNEYLVQIDHEHVLSPINAGQEKIVIPDSLEGGWAQFFDKQAYLNQWVSALTNQAEAQFQRRKRGLATVLKPITSLLRNDQAKIMEVIQEGSDKKKWFTDEELFERWGDEKNARKLVGGYKAFRRFMDEAHAYINDEVRAWMSGEGLKSVRIRKGMHPDESQYIGKPVTSVPEGVSGIWDAHLGQFRKISRDEIDEVLQNKADDASFFVELKRPIQLSGKWVHYVLVNNRRNVNIKELPDVVVPQIPGHVARIYDAAYKISKRTYTSIDGAEPHARFTTRYIYNNLAEAEADYRRLLEEAGVDPDDIQAVEQSGWKLEPTTELREDAVIPSDHMLEILENSGQLFTSKLGDELKTYSDSRVLRPIGQALQRMQNKAARIGTADMTIQKLLNNLNQTYGHLFVLDKNGRVPMIGKPTRNPDRLDTIFDKQWKEAIAARNYIRMFAGIDEGRERQFTNWVMDTVATKLATNSRHKALMEWSARATRSRDVKVTNALKMVNFARFMILNPIRQIALQMHQGSLYLGLEGGVKYWFGGKGVREWSGSILGIMFRDTEHWDEWAKTFSRAAGMSVKDYTDMVDAIRRSGIIDEIDSHQFISGYVFSGENLTSNNRYWENALGDIKDNAESILQWSRRMGFDAGEASQRIAGLLTMKNRWQLRNPKIANEWMKDENLLEITADAQVVGLNMSRAGTLEQQRNLFGLASQFSAFAQKELQLLLPEKALGRTVGRAAFKNIITAKERRNIAINHSILYGTASWGIASVIQDIIDEIGADLPQQAIETIEQGIYGTALNMGIRVASGEDIILPEDEIATSIDFSGNLAPGSAIFGGGHYSSINNLAGRIYDNLILGDRDIAALMLGPTSQTLRDISDFSEFSLYLVGMNPAGVDITLPENNNEAIRILDLFGRKFFPLYNSYVRGRAELAHGRLLSGKLEPLGEATDPEIYVRNLFGPRPRRNERIQALKRDLKSYPLIIDPLIQPNKDDLDDVAATLYDVIYQAMQMRDNEQISDDELRDVFEGNIEALKVILDPNDYWYVVNNRFHSLMTSRFAEGTEEFELVKLLSDIYGRGDGDPYEKMITKLRNMPPFEHQEKAIRIIQRYIDGTSNFTSPGRSEPED